MSIKKIFLIIFLLLFITPSVFAKGAIIRSYKSKVNMSRSNNVIRVDDINRNFKKNKIILGNLKSFNLDIPSIWVINSKDILVNEDTIISKEGEDNDDEIVLNSFVKVKGYYKDNKFIAEEIYLTSTTPDDIDKEEEKDIDMVKKRHYMRLKRMRK